MYRRGPSLLMIIYIVVGIIVAADYNYFDDVNKIREVISAILAVVLWPLVLFDVNLRIKGLWIPF
jgi:hypothetical protein